MRLSKVISGGQTGVDIVALEVAKVYGIPVGGWAPKNWMTTDGPRPVLLKSLGLREHKGGYAERTQANVVEADGTLLLVVDSCSAGTRCTKRAIRLAQKPSMEVTASCLGDYKSSATAMYVDQVRRWIQDNEIRVLNVAGNSERTYAGIGSMVSPFLRRLCKSYAVAHK